MIYCSKKFFWIISSRTSFPRKTSHKILLSKYFIHEFAEIVHLMIIDRDEYDSVISEESTSKEQSRVHHREPIRVIASSGFAIGIYTNSILDLSWLVPVGSSSLCVVIWIHEILPRVIWRIDIDTLHGSTIGTREEFQDLEIVSLDDHISLRILGIHGSGLVILETSGRRSECETLGLMLACPLESVVFTVVRFFIDDGFDSIDIERSLSSEEIREIRSESSESLWEEIGSSGEAVGLESHNTWFANKSMSFWLLVKELYFICREVCK